MNFRIIFYSTFIDSDHVEMISQQVDRLVGGCWVGWQMPERREKAGGVVHACKICSVKCMSVMSVCRVCVHVL